MVIDASVVIAILQNEAQRTEYTRAIEAADAGMMSAASFLEMSIVIETRYGAGGVRALDLLISNASVELVSVDATQAHVARDAFRSFGKGRHPAGLNFGDCFSYALAKTRAVALLFKGADFSKTDLVSAHQPSTLTP